MDPLVNTPAFRLNMGITGILEHHTRQWTGSDGETGSGSDITNISGYLTIEGRDFPWDQASPPARANAEEEEE